MQITYSTDAEYWDPTCGTELRRDHTPANIETDSCEVCVKAKVARLLPSICYSCAPPSPSPVLPTRLSFELDGEISGAPATGAAQYTSPHAAASHIHFSLTDHTTGIGNPVSGGTLIQPYYEHEELTQAINDFHVDTFGIWHSSRRPNQCDYVIDDTTHYCQGQVTQGYQVQYGLQQHDNADVKAGCPTPEEFLNGYPWDQYSYWRNGPPTGSTGDHYFKKTFRFSQRLRDWLAMRKSSGSQTHVIMNPVSGAGRLAASVSADAGIAMPAFNTPGGFTGLIQQMKFYSEATGETIPDEWGPGFTSYSGGSLWYLENPNHAGGHVYNPDHPSYNSHPKMDFGYDLYYGMTGYIWRYSPQQKELRLYGYPPSSEYTYNCIRRGATVWSTDQDGPTFNWYLSPANWPNRVLIDRSDCPGHPPETPSTIQFDTWAVHERVDATDTFPVVKGATQDQTQSSSQWTPFDLNMDEDWDLWVVDPSGTNSATFRTWNHPDHYASLAEYYTYVNPLVNKATKVAYFPGPTNIGTGTEAGFWNNVRSRDGWHLATYAVDQNCGHSVCGDWDLTLTYRWNSGANPPNQWWPTSFPATGKIRFT